MIKIIISNQEFPALSATEGKLDFHWEATQTIPHPRAHSGLRPFFPTCADRLQSNGQRGRSAQLIHCIYIYFHFGEEDNPRAWDGIVIKSRQHVVRVVLKGIPATQR